MDTALRGSLSIVRRHPLKLFGLALLYLVLAKLTLLLANEKIPTPPVRPAAGLALAACLLFGPGFWPGVFLGSLAAYLTVAGLPVANALLNATGDALAASVGAAFMLRVARPDEIFERVKTTLQFIGLSILTAQAINATLSTFGMWLAEPLGMLSLYSRWMDQWLGNAAGALMLAPWLLILTIQKGIVTIGRECFLHWLLVMALSGVIYAGWFHPETAHYPTIFLMYPLIVWSVFRFGALGLANLVLTVALFACFSTIQGLGPFFQADINASLSLLDSYILVSGGTALVMLALVTERKRTEQALLESRDRLELAMIGAELGTWDWNVQTGSVVFCDRWANMLGYALDEIEPHYRSWEKLLHPEDRERAMETINAYLQGKTGHYETEFRMLAKNGQWKWIASHGKVFERDRAGKPLRAVGIHKDIHAQKALEEHVRQQQAELLWVQRFTTAGELAATMAHELNQPLGAIASYLAGINVRFDDLLTEHPEMAHAIQETSRLTERAAEVVRSIRNLVNRHETEPEWQNPGELIEESLELIRPELLRRQIRTTTKIAEQLPQIWVQRILLQQLLLNLVLNAMEAMECIAANRRKLKIQADSREDGRAIEIIVRDSGPGIAAQMQPKIFEPFFSTRTNGIGLGLPICRSIAEAHGGRLSVSSEQGRGAAFILVLPVRKERENRHVN